MATEDPSHCELQEECFQRMRVTQEGLRPLTGRHMELNYPEKEITAFSTPLDVLTDHAHVAEKTKYSTVTHS